MSPLSMLSTSTPACADCLGCQWHCASKYTDYVRRSYRGSVVERSCFRQCKKFQVHYHVDCGHTEANTNSNAASLKGGCGESCLDRLIPLLPLRSTISASSPPHARTSSLAAAAVETTASRPGPRLVFAHTLIDAEMLVNDERTPFG